MPQRILLMSSAPNAATQRAALALGGHGHQVRTAVVADAADMARAVAANDFDLIICPYLTTAIPADIYQHHRTVIIHPGPVGDRGPASLDWALTEGHTRWGVTAIGAVAEMDAGPIWAWRTVAVQYPQTKSTLYNTVIADAAIECILETAAHAEDPGFTPTDQADAPRPVPGARTRPPMRYQDRQVPWTAPGATILARIHTADGSPGLRAELAGHTFHLYDAHPGRNQVSAEPGTIIGRRHHGIEIACGAKETIWVGHLRARTRNSTTCKGPATSVLAHLGVDLDHVPVAEGFDDDIVYHRDGDIATLTVTAYNGALTTGQCHRLADALHTADQQDTDVLVLRGGTGHFFLTGIHLGAIELAPDPAAEGWDNIRAINRVCYALLNCRQITIAAITGNAGAGGVALPLSADVVAARRRATLSPAYQPMGLTGSELHTLTLPHRVGPATARELLETAQALDTTTGHEIGLLDHIGPDDNTEFDRWLDELAHRYATGSLHEQTLHRKAARLASLAKPPSAYEAAELAAMAEDFFADRHHFHSRRQRFLRVGPGTHTPRRPHVLAGH
ncbi:enoyl-CoA hydratase-related protein [Nocardia noduli]|uniref:enoyl-CoA hydratase-related protein n=1 Tax=Nocardia noduli TaxID=2815722 RepID=UPI001C22D0AA|nr:enoyl-CoA hydratase-related protein [Nocardia noduli]